MTSWKVWLISTQKWTMFFTSLCVGVLLIHFLCRTLYYRTVWLSHESIWITIMTLISSKKVFNVCYKEMKYTAHFGQYWALHLCYMCLCSARKKTASLWRKYVFFFSGTLLCSLDRWGFAIRHINKMLTMSYVKFKEVYDFINAHWCPYPYKRCKHLWNVPHKLLIHCSVLFVCFCLFSSILLFICITANKCKLTTQPQIHCKHSKREMLYFGTFPSHVWQNLNRLAVLS